MGNEKAIVKIPLTSLEKVGNQISVVDKILSRGQLRISPTRSTPEVLLDKEGIIRISGRSIPYDTLSFFKPIEEWLNEYLNNPSDITHVDFNLEIINDDSCKFFNFIIRKITYVTLKNKKFIINWYYEEGNEDILEIGESFSLDINVPFNFVRI